MDPSQQQPQLSAEQVQSQQLGLIISELAQLKQISTAIWGKVDSEIDQIRADLSRVSNEVNQLGTGIRNVEVKLRETDGQIDRIERFETMLRNIEKQINNVYSKIR